MLIGIIISLFFLSLLALYDYYRYDTGQESFIGWIKECPLWHDNNERG